MAIPQVQQQIEPERTQATTPEELHPLAAAFGGDIGKALEASGQQLSNRIEQLTSHMYMMNYWRQQGQVADKVLQMKNDQNNVLFGDPTNPNATITKTKPDGSTYEIPAGLLQRKGNAAAGITQDYHNWYTSYSEQMVNQARDEGLGVRAIRSMKLRMDNDFASNGRLIADTEGKEVDKAIQQTFLKGMQLDADNAVIKQDPISLGKTIDSINAQNQELNDHQQKDADDPIRQITSDKFVSQALNNSMNTILKTTNDPTQAQAVLDKVHDAGKINDTVYDQATMHIDKAFTAITNENNRNARIGQVNDSMNVMSKVLQGDKGVTSVNAINDLSQRNQPLAQAMSNWTMHKDDPVDPDKMKDEDKTVATLAKNIFTSGSKEQMSGYLQQAFKDSAEGRLSQDKLNIIVSAAMDRGKRVADLTDDPPKNNPIQNAIDSGIKYLQSWGKEQGKQDGQVYTDFLGEVKGGKSVPEATHTAITNHIIRNNPAVATMDQPPNYVINKDSHIKYVFPRTNRKEEENAGNSNTGTE